MLPIIQLIQMCLSHISTTVYLDMSCDSVVNDQLLVFLLVNQLIAMYELSVFLWISTLYCIYFTHIVDIHRMTCPTVWQLLLGTVSICFATLLKCTKHWPIGVTDHYQTYQTADIVVLWPCSWDMSWIYTIVTQSIKLIDVSFLLLWQPVCQA